MRSCYRSTASETVTPNRVTVTGHRGPISKWSENFQNEKNFKAFLKLYHIFLHVSCDFNNFEQKTFFQIFQISNRGKSPLIKNLSNCYTNIDITAIERL